MPYLERPDARLFYDLTGPAEAPLVVTTHGFIENGSYWGLTGVSAALADAGFRVADLDMRGHGRSVPVGEPLYTIEAVTDDIAALAEALTPGRFALLTHATGGMAGLRYAMRADSRLSALVATDTSSATLPMDDYCTPDWDDRPFPDDLAFPGGAIMADMLAGFPNMNVLVDRLRADPESHMLGPFFRGFASSPRPERAWQWAEAIYATNNIRQCGEFARSFFADPDPQAAGLKAIRCPTLVLVGEEDLVLRAPCAMIARCVPGARLEVLPGRGHMTAIEDPEGLVPVLVGFLREATARH